MWIARIKDFKNRCKATYQDIADACGVSRSMVSRWFNGVTMPDPGYIDIMYDKFFDGLLYSADRLEALFSFAYDEKHNVDGQIGICEVNNEHYDTENTVVPIKLWHPRRGYIDAYYDRQRELLYIQYISTDLAESIGMTWEEDDAE